MARPALKPRIGFCEIGTRMIFLDVDRDRYLMMPPAIQQIIQRIVMEASLDNLDAARLVSTGLFVYSERDEARAPEPCRSSCDRPASLSVNAQSASVTPSLAKCVVAALSLALAHWGLKRLTFGKALDAALRVSRSRRAQGRSLRPDIAHVLAAFQRASWLFPRHRQCLPDALACQIYLGLMGVPTHIVFGVRSDPFEAHCWVQHENLVLGQDADVAQTFQPIWAHS